MLIVSVDNKAKIQSFPALMVNKFNGDIILFYNKGCGTKLCKGPDSDPRIPIKVGDYSRDLHISNFSLYKGKITLENQ